MDGTKCRRLDAVLESSVNLESSSEIIQSRKGMARVRRSYSRGFSAGLLSLLKIKRQIHNATSPHFI